MKEIKYMTQIIGAIIMIAYIGIVKNAKAE